MQEQSWQMPKWWYREKRPPNDNAYFENMSRIIFQAGLNWQVVDKKWPTIKKAFKDFNIKEVAKFADDDVERLLKDKGVIRNISKICAIIENAKKFGQIAKQYGSFKAYLDSIDKANNYEKNVEKLSRNFNRIGTASASLFLYTVGEKITPKEIY